MLLKDTVWIESNEKSATYVCMCALNRLTLVEADADTMLFGIIDVAGEFC